MVCLNEDLLPTYTNLRPHDPALNRNEQTQQYKKYIL